MNKPLLRSTLKNFRALPLDKANHANVMIAPQEMLDFLALRAGIKPVFLLGCGYDDLKWIEGVVAMARKAGLHEVDGPMWNAKADDEALPRWFRDHLKAVRQASQAFYICRTRSTAEEVEKSFENPPITMEQEAQLLGYPLCCVRAHYDRASLLDRTLYKMLERTANGNVEEMQRLLCEDAEIKAETPEEQAALKEATEFTPAPYTSFYMCPACIADQDGPATQLSRQYEDLALAIDATLPAQIAKNQEGVGRA